MKVTWCSECGNDRWYTGRTVQDGEEISVQKCTVCGKCVHFWLDMSHILVAKSNKGDNTEIHLDDFFKAGNRLHAGSIISRHDDTFILIALCDSDFKAYAYVFTSLTTGKAWKIMGKNEGIGIGEEEFRIFASNGPEGCVILHIQTEDKFKGSLYGSTQPRPSVRDNSSGGFYISGK